MIACGVNKFSSHNHIHLFSLNCCFCFDAPLSAVPSTFSKRSKSDKSMCLQLSVECAIVYRKLATIGLVSLWQCHYIILYHYAIARCCTLAGRMRDRFKKQDINPVEQPVLQGEFRVTILVITFNSKFHYTNK